MVTGLVILHAPAISLISDTNESPHKIYLYGRKQLYETPCTFLYFMKKVQNNFKNVILSIKKAEILVIIWYGGMMEL